VLTAGIRNKKQEAEMQKYKELSREGKEDIGKAYRRMGKKRANPERVL